MPSGVLGPETQRWKDSGGNPCIGECKECAGAGCLEVGPGMCQLLQEPREDAGNTGVFQEVWAHLLVSLILPYLYKDSRN